MITENQQAIIQKIQELQDGLERGMSDRLPVIFKSLYESVIDLTNDLPLDPKDRAANIRAVIDLKTQIGALITQNKEYVAEVAKITEGFKDLKKLSDSYFSELIDGFNAKEELYKEILKANIETTVDKLIGSGIQQNFKNAITEVLKANNAGSGNRSQLQKVLREFIEGTPEQKAFLDRYVKQVTSDSIMTFSREYNNIIAEDLNLQYYFYAGTVISDSRPFCVARTGRYFKKSEVQGWAKLGDWSGRSKGTTSVTIFSLAGGYFCRHELYPVSKQQYTVASKKNLAGLK
jgi:hypothetical protein